MLHHEGGDADRLVDREGSTTAKRRAVDRPSDDPQQGGQGLAATETIDKLSSRLCAKDLQIDALSARVNSWEREFSSYQVLVNLLKMTSEIYRQARPSLGTHVSIANKFYIEVDQPPDAQAKPAKVAVSIPQEKERLVYSLWLGRVSKGYMTILGRKCEVKLHTTQAYAEKPLPILRFVDDPGKWIPVKRQADQWRHSFMCKNAPDFPGIVLDSQDIGKWCRSGNFATSEQVVLLPGNQQLEDLIAVWMGRKASNPPEATLVVDSKSVRDFVTTISLYDQPRLHFMCVGTSHRLYAYFALTDDSDGVQSEVARLPVGSAAFRQD